MQILIVEDEPQAAERLYDLISQHRPDARLAGQTDSVAATVRWLQQHTPPDLAFFDIHLADGSCFSIFEQLQIHFPIVFTTAYDQYALKAFEVHSIDYLLKPIDPEDLKRAFDKYDHYRSPAPDLRRQLEDVMQIMRREYKTRFVVNTGHHLEVIPTADILYFFSENKITWLRLPSGAKHAVDYTLEQLEDLLDPKQFFRISRQCIVSLQAVNRITPFSSSRLKIELPYDEIKSYGIVSRNRVHEFKEWVGG